MVFKDFKNFFALLHQKRKRKKNLTANHTVEQADNPPLRYVTLMSHACIVFVSLVSLKR